MKYITSFFALMLFITSLIGDEDFFEVIEINEMHQEVIDGLFYELNKGCSCVNEKTCKWNLKENYPIQNKDESIITYIFEALGGGHPYDSFIFSNIKLTEDVPTSYVWARIAETYLEDKNNIIDIIYDNGYETMYHIKNNLNHIYGRILKKVRNNFRHYEIQKNYLIYNINPTFIHCHFYSLTQELETDMNLVEIDWQEETEFEDF